MDSFFEAKSTEEYEEMIRFIQNAYDCWSRFERQLTEWATAIGFTLAEARVLICISHFQNRRISQAAVIESAQMPKQTVSKVLSSLEKSGVIRRIASKEDKRALSVEFTAQGLRQYKDLFAYLMKMGYEITNGFTPEERTILMMLREKYLKIASDAVNRHLDDAIRSSELKGGEEKSAI